MAAVDDEDRKGKGCGACSLVTHWQEGRNRGERHYVLLPRMNSQIPAMFMAMPPRKKYAPLMAVNAIVIAVSGQLAAQHSTAEDMELTSRARPAEL